MPAGARVPSASSRPGETATAQVPCLLPVGSASFAHDIRNILSHLQGYALLDLLLPCMNGLEALGAVIAKWPTFPAIVATTSADVGEAEVRARGAQGFLRKSFSAGEFPDVVRAALTSERETPPADA